MVEFLLAHGTDPETLTRIDDYTSPLEEAESRGHSQIVQLLQNVTKKGPNG